MKKKILIVVDMQKDFVDGSLGTKEAQAIIPNVVDKIVNWEGPVIATFDTHRKNYMETNEGRHLPVAHCIRKTEGWKLDKNVLDALESRKKNYRKFEKGTFGSIELAEDIFDIYGDKVDFELIGLCTDICVVSNALILKAYFPESNISVDSSCCAGVTPETHEAALTTMKMCQIEVL